MRSGVTLLQGSVWILLSLSVSFSEPARAQTETIQIDRGFSKILELPHPAHLVAVGDPTVADATIGTTTPPWSSPPKRLVPPTSLPWTRSAKKSIWRPSTLGTKDLRSGFGIRPGIKIRNPGQGSSRHFCVTWAVILKKKSDLRRPLHSRASGGKTERDC